MGGCMSDLAAVRSLSAFDSTRPVSTWSFSSGKRIFDVVFALIVLIAACPLMIMLALLIKTTSRGPVLFRHRRAGQDGRPFLLLKFRSMTTGPVPGPGLNLTRGGDPRVTRVGRFLRRTKVDELPQMYNVLRGEMSVVGPRPDVPEFMDALAPDLRPVLLLKPGITSVASVQFRHEESILAAVPADQICSFYMRELLPRKVALDFAYARKASFGSDLKVIARTAAILLR